MTDRPDPADLVLLGVVTGVRGLKGDLRIRSFTADPEGLAAYGPLWDKAAVRSYELRITGDAKGQLIGRIDGVRDRTQAEALKGLELHVPRDALPAPDDDEFYHADLLGLRAVSAAGEDLGSVSAVEDYGAGTVLEIAGGPYKGLMVPFTRDVVTSVDIPAGTLTVDPPDGLLTPPDDEAKATEERT